jgi:4-hydroxy-tetrahydrodipicolinate synthase
LFQRNKSVRNHNFSGLWIPLVTPFASDGSVDHAALTALVRRLRKAPIAGLVACGSTGEAAALDKTEQLAVLDTVLQAAQGLPVVMGVSGYHLPQMQAWVRQLQEGRALAGLLVPAPHYIRPGQDGIVQWFHSIADASRVPLIVYDIPYRTGVQITRDTLLTLAAHPGIQALKDCGGDAAKTQALIADGRLQLLAGEDAQLFSTVAAGGAGAIAASAHIETARFCDVLSLLAKGQLVEARVHWQELAPVIEALFAEPNPAPLKAMLAQQGEMANVLREPMMPASPALTQRLAALVSPR